MALNNGTSKSNIQFPSHDINPSEKDEQYHLQWAEAIYSIYKNDRGGIKYSEKTNFELLRHYAKGLQDVEKYLDILCPKDPKTHERKSLMNISWDIVSVIPKIREAVVGNLLKIDHDIVASAIDEKSGGEKEDYIYSLIAEKKVKSFAEGIQEGMYEGDHSDIIDFVPDSVEERNRNGDFY